MTPLKPLLAQVVLQMRKLRARRGA